MPTASRLATFDIPRQQLAQGLLVWAFQDARMMLVDIGGWTPDPSADFYVSQILSAGAIELTDGSYSRQTLISPTETLDTTNHRDILSSDPVDFGLVDGSEAWNTAVLFAFVTDDTDSYLIGAWDCGAQTTDGTNITLAPDATFGWAAI